MIARATIFHTPENPFQTAAGLEALEDGGLLVRDGRIAACGDFATVRAAHPSEPVRDLRGGILLPGFVDAHIHFPQVRVIGAIGYTLLDWLQKITLPEEAKFGDVAYADAVASEFVHALAAHGTTTALVFGAHFSPATAALFERAREAGLRIAAGMVLSDRLLRPELHHAPEAAYRESSDLIARYHRNGRLLYAVTPRFALSSSEAILDVCAALMREHADVRFQTHINESPHEVHEVARQFPAARDYFDVYERHHLAGRRSVFAHNVHATDSELERMREHGCSVAYCPASNMALGSGFFPLHRHLSAGVRFALGTDVGGGTGFGMLKEGLQAYLSQRLAPDRVALTAAHLLYLATRAGAESLQLENEIGDFTPGKAADLVYLRPSPRSPLAAVMRNAPDAERLLAATFTLAGSDTVQETWVAGAEVYRKKCETVTA